MRRRVALVLLVLLSFQFCWNVAAAYCGHEIAPGARHFGHHLHVHTAKAEGDFGHKLAGAAIDADCAGCSLSAAPALPASLLALATMPPPRRRPGRQPPSSRDSCCSC